MLRGGPVNVALRCKISWLALGGTLGMLSAGRASAANTVYELAYERGSPPCPDGRTFQVLVSERLGFDPFASHPSERKVGQLSVAIARKASFGFVATLRLLRFGLPPAERVIASQSCPELVASTALTTSLLIDPLGRGAREVNEDRTNPNSVRASMPSKEGVNQGPTHFEEGVSQPLLKLRDRPRAELGVGGGATWGVVPAPVPSVFASLGIRHASWSLGIEPFLVFAGTAGGASGAVRADALGAAILGCAHIDFVFMCAVSRAASLSAQGMYVDEPRSANAFTLSVGGRVGATLVLSRAFSIRPFFEATTHVVPAALALDNERLWTTPHLAFVPGALLVGTL